ncbi:hypothetical protein B1F84_02410 [Pseudoalteromonas sp. DL-6]|nr:hypothetical protein B1F84_02410 [Pseudoalteromonas sp. DL-6]
MKNCLIITDSLGLARAEPELVRAHEAWTQIVISDNSLREKFNFYIYSRFGYTSEGLKNEMDTYLKAYEPDIIILQVGLVDCYPRAMKKVELAIIRLLPSFLQRLIRNLISKHYKKLTKWRTNRYVTPNDFAQNLSLFRNKFENSEFLIIPIAPAHKSICERNSKFEESVSLFNLILSDIFPNQFCKDIYESMDGEIFLSDGQHLSVNGNKQLAEKVTKLLDIVNSTEKKNKNAL